MKKFLEKLDGLASIGIVSSLLLFTFAIIASKVIGEKIDLLFLLSEIVMIISICFIAVCYISSVVELIRDVINSKNNKEKKDE